MVELGDHCGCDFRHIYFCIVTSLDVLSYVRSTRINSPTPFHEGLTKVLRVLNLNQG